jgi:hypothetical protein
MLFNICCGEVQHALRHTAVIARLELYTRVFAATLASCAVCQPVSQSVSQGHYMVIMTKGLRASCSASQDQLVGMQ